WPRDWSADVCSSDLLSRNFLRERPGFGCSRKKFRESADVFFDKPWRAGLNVCLLGANPDPWQADEKGVRSRHSERSEESAFAREIGRASCRERRWMS